MPYHKMTEEEKKESRKKAAAKYRQKNREKIQDYQKNGLKRYTIGLKPEDGKKIEELAKCKGLTAPALIKTLVLNYINSQKME